MMRNAVAVLFVTFSLQGCMTSLPQHTHAGDYRQLDSHEARIKQLEEEGRVLEKRLNQLRADHEERLYVTVREYVKFVTILCALKGEKSPALEELCPDAPTPPKPDTSK